MCQLFLPLNSLHPWLLVHFSSEEKGCYLKLQSQMNYFYCRAYVDRSSSMHLILHYGNTGFGVFKRGVQSLEDFCLRINMDYARRGEIQSGSLVFFKVHCPCILPCLTQSILKGNYWILKIRWMGRCQNLTLRSKMIRIFLNFFFIEEYHFKSTLFVIDIFYNINSQITLFSKWCPIFTPPH